MIGPSSNPTWDGKPRILLVSHETTFSGAVIELLHLAGWLNARGWRITIVAPEDGPVLDPIRSTQIDLIFDAQLLIDPAYGTLRRLAREYDLVLANTIVAWQAVQAAHLEQTPVVWYLHETKVGLWLMDKIPMIQPSLGLTNALIVPTKATARIYQPLTRRPVWVVPYGIPDLGLQPLQSAKREITFATTATYESRKGQDILVEAIRKLDPETLAGAQFFLAGRPLEESFHAQLRLRTAKLTNVNFLGPLDHKQAIDLLRQADVVICPSRDETMPIFLIEAMSLGRAVISTAVGGVEEWLHDGQNALVVPSENSSLLAEAIARCIQDRDLVLKLAQAGRATFDNHFAMQPFGEQVEAILSQTIEFPNPFGDPGTDREWAELYETPRQAERIAVRRRIELLEEQPVISVVLPVYNPEMALLEEAIESVRRQIYPNWELCIADDASTNPEVRPFLEGKAVADARIKVVFRTFNGHISACSNSALELATGKWCALLDQDDLLAEHALALVACEADAFPEAGLIYSDEDKIDLAGHRSNLFLKTDWNPELFLGQNYINHLGSYRTDLLRQIGGFRIGLEGSQDYDLALRCIERLQSSQIRHIPRILYHWRTVPGSLAEKRDAKPYAKEAARLALNDHLQRCCIGARAEPCPENVESHRVKFDMPEPRPRLAVIIPVVTQCDRLVQRVESIRALTNSSDQIVIVADESVAGDLPSLQKRGLIVLKEKFAGNRGRMLNAGVSRIAAASEIALFLDPAVQPSGEEWLREMISQISRPEVGVVGARLWSPDGILRYGGMVLGLCGIASEVHTGIPREHPGYFNRAFLQRNCSAISMVCAAMRAELFRELGGFDEELSISVLQDVDFCLRIWDSGRQVVWTPYADLVIESDVQKVPLSGPDADRVRNRWGNRLNEDPFYSPNLSVASLVFQFAFPPRWLNTTK